MWNKPVRWAVPGVPVNFHRRARTTATQDHEDHRQELSSECQADAVDSQSPSVVDERRRTYWLTPPDDDIDLVHHVTCSALPVCLFCPITVAKTTNLIIAK